jgi:hypothetical protein
MKMLWKKLSMFDIHTVIADLTMEFPREGDQFIMQVLVRAGYTGEALSCLNRVRVSLQLLFIVVYTDCFWQQSKCRHPLAPATRRSMVDNEVAQQALHGL